MQVRLTKDSLHLCQVKNGGNYFKLSTEFNTKKSSRWYCRSPNFSSSQKDSKPEQVFDVRFLLSKLNPDYDRLFQKEKCQYDAHDMIWSENMALGKNTLGEMMKAIVQIQFMV